MDRETDRQGTGNHPRGNETHASCEFWQAQEARLKELEEEALRIRQAMAGHSKGSKVRQPQPTRTETSVHLTRHTHLRPDRSHHETYHPEQRRARSKEVLRPKEGEGQGMMVPHAAPRVGGGETRAFRRIIKGMKSPSFSGKVVAGNEAEVWIDAMEKYFTLNSVTEVEKTRLATYQLDGNASLWWKHCKQMHSVTEMECPWDKFKALFQQEYLSEHYLKGKEIEFLSLQQGRDSVEDYTLNFRRLSHYVPYMAHDDTLKTKYIMGLIPQLQDKIKTVEPKTLEETIRKTRFLETEIKNRREATSQHKRARPTGGGSSSGKDIGKGLGAQKVTTAYAPVKFVKSQSGMKKPINTNPIPAVQNLPICYNCQKPGHIVRACPLRKAVPPRSFGQVKHVASESRQQERQHRPSVYRGRPSYRQRNPVRGHQATQERVSPIAPETDMMMPATIASSGADRQASLVRPPDMEE